MSVPLSLLKPFGRAQGFMVYGGPGMRKTFAAHTLPPPILLSDFEGGSQSIIPWTRRTRKWDSDEWTEFSDEDRQEAFDMLSQENKDYITTITRINPRPYVDVVFYDNMDPHSYAAYIKDVINFDYQQYKSTALDSIKEFSEDIRTMAKGEGNELAEFNPSLWGGVQDRTGALCRYLRNYRDKGVFVYLTSGESIDKDYIKDPREKRPRGEQPPEPISIKGNITAFGRMPNELQHLVDIQLHARPRMGEPIWVRDPEPLAPGSVVCWEAKDRTGRIKQQYIFPNFREIIDNIYGQERRRAIYAAQS